MPDMVAKSASMTCFWGDGSKELMVPENGICAKGKPVATLKDCVAVLNIPSFGECKSLTNPMVATATAAAEGELQPQKCIPIIAMPWEPVIPGILVNGMPVLNDLSKCECAWADGIPIKIDAPGTANTSVT